MSGRTDLAAAVARQDRRPPRFRQPRTLRPIGPTIACEVELRRIIGRVLREAAELVRERGLPAAREVSERLIVDAPSTDLGWFADLLRRRLGQRAQGLSGAVLAALQGEEARHRLAFQGAVRASFGIDLSPVLAQGDVREHVVLASERATGLIQGLADDVSKRLSQTLIEGVVRGRRHSEIAKDLSEDLGISRRRAALIARNETATLNGTLNQVRQRQAGVRRYVWSTALDERVRPLHAEREGRTFSWDDPPSDGHPGEPINCRCVARALIEIGGSRFSATDAAFEEVKHPRGFGGKFSDKPGSRNRRRNWARVAPWERPDFRPASLGKGSPRDDTMSTSDKERLRETFSSVTSEQKRALKKYANYAGDINSALRSGKAVPDQKMLERMDEAFAGSPGLPFDLVVYRSVKDDVFMRSFKPGDVMLDPAFVSTQVGFKLLSSMPHISERESQYGQVKMRIIAPAGTKAIFMHPFSDDELLLDRGLRFEFKGRDAKGIYDFVVVKASASDADFDETEHPRGRGGKFSSKFKVVSSGAREGAEAIRQYLEMIARLDSRTLQKWMLDHGGRAFDFGPQSFEGKKGPQQMCYMNAGREALAGRGQYVEGYVSVHGVPLSHAWIVDEDGYVRDPTLGDGKGIMGYFGVPIRTEYLRRTILRNEVWGVLQHNNYRAIMTDDPRSIVAEKLTGDALS